ncbi:lysozyme inhibitor LprI family protein [Xanthobacter versatilis]|uniref:lysozyme inhibitor LprI family protein n=1 Tax=Xanthobacter autotrophicus (strain ATCC BAA-1158 / Py2) TaxID=78245 RepID=UPI0037267ABA
MSLSRMSRSLASLLPIRLRSALVPAMLAATVLALAPAAAASFDCASARAADEKAVCDSCDLAQLDVKMSTLYGVLTKLVAMGQRGMIQDAQRAWLAQRSTCGGDTSCLSGAYRSRIAQLEAALGEIYSRGPF